jgi:hypothetical protein
MWIDVRLVWIGIPTMWIDIRLMWIGIPNSSNGRRRSLVHMSPGDWLAFLWATVTLFMRSILSWYTSALLSHTEIQHCQAPPSRTRPRFALHAGPQSSCVRPSRQSLHTAQRRSTSIISVRNSLFDSETTEKRSLGKWV